MTIKSLKLENYRRFHKLDLEFPENLIGVTGRNGSGKSSIIEAIGWALYGNRIARTDKEDIRSQFCDSSEMCAAELEFACGGHEYRIVRQLKGKNAISEAGVYRDGRSEPEAVQERGVNGFVESLLGLDYRSFFASVFARQRELAALSAMQPEERRKSINRLINIDSIDRAREKVRRDRNEKRAFVDGLKAGLKDIDVLRQEMADFKSLVVEQEGQLKSTQAEILKRETELKESKQDFDAISEKRDRFLELEARLGKLKSRHKDHGELQEQGLLELSEIAKAEQRLHILESKLRDFENIKSEKERLDKEALRKAKLDGKISERHQLLTAKEREKERVSELESKAAALEALVTELQELEEKITHLEVKQTELRQQAKRAHADRQTAERAGKDEKQKRDRVVELGADSPCPVCTRPLHDHYDEVVKGFNDKIEELRKEYLSAKQIEQQSESELAGLESQLKDGRKERDIILKKRTEAKEADGYLQRAREGLRNFEQQEKLLDEEIARIGAVEYDETEHRTVKKQFDELSELHQEFVKLKERAQRKPKVEAELARINKILSETAEELQQVVKSQQLLGFSEEDFLKAKSEVEEKTMAYNKTQEALSVVREKLAGLRKDVERVKHEIAEQKEKRKEIEISKEEIVYLDALDEHFGHFRLELAGRMRPLIAARASELFRITTDSRYSLVELDQDYNIKIYDGNVAYPIARFSGGEQDLANLCLRIAISQVVAERSGGTPINFIVLDEIFGSQDEERKELILNALSQLSSQFRQIFIITHVESIKDVVPVMVSVEVKDDMVSEARMV